MVLLIGVFLLNGYKAIRGTPNETFGVVGMRNSSQGRANIAIFLAVLALSALTMVWLFWHHPIKTLIGTIAVLAALGISARLARAIDVEVATASDLDHREQGV